jgi:hypothetical protein
MSHAIPAGTTRQAADACRQLVARPGLPFADYLPAARVNEAVTAAGGAFRERAYAPAVTLWTFLCRTLDPGHSCRAAVARPRAHRAAQGLAPGSADAGAYCKARARLPEAALAGLARAAGRALMDNAEEEWLWKGRRVKVVDGTSLSMPDTPGNRKAYPKQVGLPDGVGFPFLRLVVVFSLAAGAALGAAVGPFNGAGTGEVSLFRRPGGALGAGDVVLADRLYSNSWGVARLRGRGFEVVTRLHAGRRAVWFRGRGHSTANRRVWWRKPQRPGWVPEEEYKSYPQKIRPRAVRVDVRRKGPRTRRLALVTTLTDAAAYTKKDLADLYKRRWQAELNLRSLRAVMPMGVLRGRSPDVVRKGVWAHLLAYNVVRGLMARAAAVRPDEVSFAGAPQAVNAFLPLLRGARSAAGSARRWAALVLGISRHRVGNRPDGYEPRAVKRRPKNDAKLKVPRAEARRRLRERTSRAGKKG